MIPFIAAQLHTLLENIRLLEAFVTAPLGLYSDLKMLRESLPYPEAANLANTEERGRRIGLRRLTDSPTRMMLDTIAHIEASLAILQSATGKDGQPLTSEWVARAHRVLARVDQKVAGELRAEIAARIRGLYVIVDPEATNGRPVVEVARAALEGGAKVVQLRDKAGDKGHVLPIAAQVKSACDDYNALFIVNDDADVALASDAHGLHVGQTDLPVSEARRVLTSAQLVGRSNNSVAEAMDSRAQRADYLAVGAVFPTSSLGKGDRDIVGTETVAKVREMVDVPVVAIGGINADNVAEVVKAGAHSACVVSAVTLADDPADAARRIVEAIEGAAG